MPIGTKPPYYGNIAVSAILGDLVSHNISIANVPLPDAREAAYLAYEDGRLARLAVINMVQYNYTINGTTPGTTIPNPMARPNETYTFTLEGLSGGSDMMAGVTRLFANGSDAITGVTWDGYSYNYELDEGRPVILGNVTRGEFVDVNANGSVTINVPFSSVAVLNFSAA